METITGMAEASRGVLVRSDSREKGSLSLLLVRFPLVFSISRGRDERIQPDGAPMVHGRLRLLGGKGLACGPHALHEIRMTS